MPIRNSTAAAGLVIAWYLSGAWSGVASAAEPNASTPLGGSEAHPEMVRGSIVDASLEPSHFYGQAETNLSIFAQSDDADSPGVLFRAFALAVKGGRRWGDKALFLALETAFWRSTLLNSGSELAMAANIGMGGEILSANGLIRTSLAFGPSILVIPTSVDRGGELGFFLDLRPAGFRFKLVDQLLLGVDPLSFTLIMPVLSGIPLVEVEYRSSVYVEHAL